MSSLVATQRTCSTSMLPPKRRMILVVTTLTPYCPPTALSLSGILSHFRNAGDVSYPRQAHPPCVLIQAKRNGG
jgi:hypothetical protein